MKLTKDEQRIEAVKAEIAAERTEQPVIAAEKVAGVLLREGRLAELRDFMSKPTATARDYHDVPFPEGTQPTATAGEWTVERLLDELNHPVISHEAVAWTVKQINAALNAERKDHTERMNSVQDFYSRQLAAEREKREALNERREATFRKVQVEWADRGQQLRKELEEARESFRQIMAVDVGVGSLGIAKMIAKVNSIANAFLAKTGGGK